MRGRLQKTFFFEHLSILVSLASRRLEVEDQVLHVQSQLRECLLDEIQNATSPGAALNRTGERGSDRVAIMCGEAIDRRGQLTQFLGISSFVEFVDPVVVLCIRQGSEEKLEVDSLGASNALSMPNPAGEPLIFRKALPAI